MKSNGFSIQHPKTPEQFNAYYSARHKLTRKPYGLPKGSEMAFPFIKELSGIHLCACLPESNRIVGVAMGYVEKGRGNIYALGVEELYKRSTVPKALICKLEEKLKNAGVKYACVDATKDAVEFYQTLNYIPLCILDKGEVAKMTGVKVDCIRMEKHSHVLLSLIHISEPTRPY
eukprot:TRINITY_DN13392_c0_g3_i1.p1 TRINITY_DN13392_c0_g3~~TRINITY_DN13392_c0_g3_i1.p1  ORF type:complete len:174 (-),score=36.08 TRINITY_DN13392_c0_g3_i1:48-569(-)